MFKIKIENIIKIDPKTQDVVRPGRFCTKKEKFLVKNEVFSAENLAFLIET